MVRGEHRKWVILSIALAEPTRTRLAVLGFPIAHSRSPAVHAAAYRTLGVALSYERIEIDSARLAPFIRSLDGQWRGLSLTMPLKRDILDMLSSQDPLVGTVGVANTVLCTARGLVGYNTDVFGMVRSFQDAGRRRLERVWMLGAGATTSSAIVAVAELGALRVDVFARDEEAARRLIPIGASVQVEVLTHPWGAAGADRGDPGVPDAVVSTVPAGTGLPSFAIEVRERAVLFDVTYEPWPSPLARHWEAAGGAVISGHELLLNQALGQVRLFIAGESTTMLPEEEAVLAAMRAAVWED